MSTTLLRRMGRLTTSAVLLAALWGGCSNSADDLLIAPNAAITTLSKSKFVGSETCNTCHKAQYESWEKSNHTKKLVDVKTENIFFDSNADGTDDFKAAGSAGYQLGTATQVKATAWAAYTTNAPILLYENSTYKMQLGQTGTKYEIRKIMGASGKWKQRFVTSVTVDGKEVFYTLPVQYDIKTNSYSVYNAAHWYNTTTFAPTGTMPSKAKSWQANCITCHATGVTDVKVSSSTGSDGTVGHVVADFSEFNIGCEACHGPGSNHVSLGGGIGTINNPRKMGRERALEDCEQCHSRGDAKYEMTSGTTTWEPEYPRAADGAFYRPGDKFADFYTVTTSSSQLWSDNNGRSKGHHQQAMDFKKDIHFEKDVQCFDCHAPHGGEQGASLKMESTKLCLSCHNGKGDIDADNLTAHTKHPLTREKANECISCHMPYMAKSSVAYDIKTHLFKIVYPAESDSSHGGVSGMPNSCQAVGCHSDDSIADLNTKALTLWGNFAPIPQATTKDISGSTTDTVSYDARGAWQLDGSKSLDGNGWNNASTPAAIDSITYQWTIIDGPSTAATQLFGADSATPYFMPTAAGTYTIELVVTDGGGVGDTARTTTTVVAPAPFVAPTASGLSVNAGSDIAGQTWGASVTTLAATASGGTGTVAYQWEVDTEDGLPATFAVTTGNTATDATPDVTLTTPLQMIEKDNIGSEYRSKYWRPIGFSPLERQTVLQVYVTDANTISYTAGNETKWYNRASDSVKIRIENDGAKSRGQRQTGLSTVGVGEITYFAGAFEAVTPPNNGTDIKAWKFSLAAPGGSVATLPAGTDNVASTTRYTYFTPDVAGRYTITYTGYSDTAATTQVETGAYVITAASFVGHGRQAFTLSGATLVDGAVTADNNAQCATAGCHTTKVSDWKGSNHAHALVKGLSGLKGSYFSASCVDCHSTGYDQYATNAGFDDEMSGDPWTFPTITGTATAPSLTNWESLVNTAATADTAARANIGCERCHGPGGQHTAAGVVNTGSSSFDIGVLHDDDQCQVCHDEPTHHVMPLQLRESVHKLGRSSDEDPEGSSVASRGGSDGCAKCHSSEGYILVNGKTNGDDDVTFVTGYRETNATLGGWEMKATSSIPTTLYIRYSSDAANATVSAYSNSKRNAETLVASVTNPLATAGTWTLLKSAAAYLNVTGADTIAANTANTDFTLSIDKRVAFLTETNDGSNQLITWYWNEVNMANTLEGSGYLYVRSRYTSGTNTIDIEVAKDSAFANLVASGTATYANATATGGTTVTLTEQNGSGFKNGSVKLTYSADDSDIRLRLRWHDGGTDIGCVTCHDPHVKGGDSGHNVRNQGARTLITGAKTEGAGLGNVCIGCHQSRRMWNESTTTSSHWGPHYGIPGDMLFGTNGYEKFTHLLRDGVTPATNMKDWDRANPHATVENTCVGCHMAVTPSSADKGRHKVGEHTFRLKSEDSKYSNHENACQSCHVNVTALNRHSKADYDGDGHVEGSREEVEGLLELLKVELQRIGYLNSAGAPVAGITINTGGLDDKAGALWNFLCVEEDKSHGIHNPGYMIQLLQEGYRAINGGYPKGATIR